MILVPIFVVAVFLIVAVMLISQYLRYQGIPTMQEYLSRHPECRTARGLKCFQCNSQSIRNWGLQNAASSSRVHICNHCGAKLYRTG